MSGIGKHRRVLYPVGVTGASIPRQSKIAFTLGSAFGLISWPSSTLSGSLLVMGVTAYGGATITTPTGWTKIGEVTNGTAIRTALYYVQNASSRGSDGMSFSGTCDHYISIAEYPGLATVGAFDKFASNSGDFTVTGVMDTGTTATTSQANELCFAVFGVGVAVGGAGVTNRPTNRFRVEQLLIGDSGVSNYIGCFSDRIVSNTLAATTSLNCSDPTATKWTAMIATFKF